MGRIERIFLRPSARTPVREETSAVAVLDRGLQGDHAVGGRRQVTILSLDSWREACDELGVDLDPSARRANLVVSGIDLQDTRGRRLILGDCVLEIGGETRPCELLDDSHLGLNRALRTDWRGGVYGRVVQAGPLEVGATVRWSSSANP